MTYPIVKKLREKAIEIPIPPQTRRALCLVNPDGEEAAAVIEQLAKALEPFAEAAPSYDPDEGDGKNPAWAHDFTIGSLRRARAALRKLKGE